MKNAVEEDSTEMKPPFRVPQFTSNTSNTG